MRAKEIWLLVFAAATVWLVATLAHLLLVVFAGVLLGVALDGLSRPLRARLGLPRQVAVGVTCAAVCGLGLAAAWGLGTPLVVEGAQLARRLPEAGQQALDAIERRPWAAALLGPTDEVGELVPDRSALLGHATGWLSTTLGALGLGVVALFVGVYVAFDPTPYRRGLIALIPPERRARGEEVLASLGGTLRRFLVGQLTAMTLVGTLIGVGLFGLGVPMPVVLGTLAGVCAFVPYLGPAVALAPALLLAWSQQPGSLVWVVGLFTLVEGIESYVITPLVQRQAVELPPALIVTMQLLLGFLLGVLGVALSTPLTVVGVELVRSVRAEDVGDETTRD